MSSPIIKFLAAKSASYDNEPVQDTLRFFNPSPWKMPVFEMTKIGVHRLRLVTCLNFDARNTR
jgi:hypothetical protein